jgi:hypothetical protein
MSYGILMAMKTATLELAMKKAAMLPAATQEQIGREVLERIDRIAHVRAELEIGVRQLDAGLGKPLDIEEVITTARAQHGNFLNQACGRRRLKRTSGTSGHGLSTLHHPTPRTICFAKSTLRASTSRRILSPGASAMIS